MKRFYFLKETNQNKDYFAGFYRASRTISHAQKGIFWGQEWVTLISPESMERQNCLMVLVSIILGGYVIIFSSYVIIFGD